MCSNGKIRKFSFSHICKEEETMNYCIKYMYGYGVPERVPYPVRFDKIIDANIYIVHICVLLLA